MKKHSWSSVTSVSNLSSVKMQLMNRLVSSAILLAPVLAAPNLVPATTTNSASPAVLFKPSPGDSINDCGDSSFENDTSNASPTADDCEMIARNIAGGGTWEVPFSGQHQLVQYGSCAFGVQWNGNTATHYYVGNQDIMDLINSAVTMFEWNGLVGARGVMNCESDELNAMGGNVLWGLYHN